jgi:hypothetical protein
MYVRLSFVVVGIFRLLICCARLGMVGWRSYSLLHDRDARPAVV